jgi:hypothetical protein
LNKEVKNSSIIGKAMLKIIVMMIIAPITLYQSAVNPSYFPANMKLIYELLILEGLKLTFKTVMMTPILSMSRKALLKV